MAREGRRKEQAQKLRGLAAMAAIAQRQQRHRQLAEAQVEQTRQFEEMLPVEKAKAAAAIARATRPKTEARPEIAKLQSLLDTLPPNSPHRAALESRIEKLAAPAQSAVTIQMPGYAGMSTIQTEEGPQNVLVQAPKGGGPPTVTKIGEKPPSSTEISRREKIKTAESGFKSAIGDLDNLIAQVEADPGVVGAAGFINRMVEGVSGQVPATRGTVKPSALKFQTDLKAVMASNWRNLVGGGQLSVADYNFLQQIFRGEGVFDEPEATKYAFRRAKEYIRKKAESSGVKFDREVVRTGKHKGRKVIEYSDGTIEYGD